MNDDERQFENFVSNVKFDDTPDPIHRDKLEQDLLATLAKQRRQKDSPLIIWRTIMKSRITKLAAAAAVLIVGLVFWVGDGQQTLYAQVVEALEQARTIHVLVKEYRDGEWFKDHEIWYDREAGIVEEERYEGRTDVRIDNGRYEWRYAEGSELIAQLKTYRDNDEIARQLCGAEWLRYDPNRIPSGDKVIDGVPCKMYALSMPDGSEKASIWVNENHRILKLEQEEQREGQKIRSVGTIEYDIEIDKNLFSPNFDSTVKIVDPREFIEQQFPLNTAIFKRESLGLVFAVHKLEFGNGLKYLACSNRITEQTRDEISNGHPSTTYGQYELYGRYDDESGMHLETSDEPVMLAQMSYDGIQVQWYILIPSGSKAKQTSTCDVNVEVNTVYQLRKKLKAEGLPIQEKFRLNITLGQAKEQLLSLREIASQIYSLGKKFDPIVGFFLRKIVIEQDGNKALGWKKPGIELSEEEYSKDVERRVQKWLERGK